MGTDGKFSHVSLRTNQKLQETFRLERVKKLTSADGGVCVDCAHVERVCRSSSPSFD